MLETAARLPLPDERVLRHIVDVHCHPTDDPSISSSSMDSLQITICAMSTRQSDQALVRDLAKAYPHKVIPCFGYHPWFTHRISLRPITSKQEHYRSLFVPSPSKLEHEKIFDKLLPLLPDPISLDDLLVDLRRNLDAFPNAMLGEVGLDRAFRIAFDYSAPSRELTPFTIPFDHQLAVLEAQLDLAVQLGRNVSFHSVKAQLGTMDCLSRMLQKYGDQWINISIDMHSCGLSAQMWRDIEKKHPNVFLSLSTVINSRSENHKALIAACSPHRILVESDFNDVNMCTERTWDMLQTVAKVKNWPIEEQWTEDLHEDRWGAVRKLEENWKAFQRGSHKPYPPKRRGKRKTEEEWESEESDD